ncbi:TIGR00282 family metallophosphoesterase [Ruminococcus albus]|uniref:Metallophosphoesterase n=1 Tax=Ruminococcus albus TaxID=1264 RepID=A0A1H7MLR7_RUMAL|nr:TIGR00282 family metallophosphoesterase [Ruminococcus albus]SEL12061.1 hypothetical protein SAMN05216469_11241 [Ruminococcus albus]
MNLLFIGDVVGCSGTDFLEEQLYGIKRKYNIDVTVVNGENSAQGNGITPQSFDRLISMGVDVVTTGNHCFRRREVMELYDSSEFLLRPANFPEGVAGRGVGIIDLCPVKIAVVNLMGTMYMEALDNPFTEIDKILDGIDTPNIFVDFHAEATSEKKAMGHYLKGRVTAVMGTHTHVQTADEVILGGHTAYITDVGMTGPEFSVLGVDSDIVIDKFRYHCPVKFTESDSPCFLNGVVVSFDEKSGKSTNITRIISRK